MPNCFDITEQYAARNAGQTGGDEHHGLLEPAVEMGAGGGAGFCGAGGLLREYQNCAMICSSSACTGANTRSWWRTNPAPAERSRLMRCMPPPGDGSVPCCALTPCSRSIRLSSTSSTTLRSGISCRRRRSSSFRWRWLSPRPRPSRPLPNMPNGCAPIPSMPTSATQHRKVSPLLGIADRQAHRNTAAGRAVSGCSPDDS
jgi:hypothetical protein